MERGVVCSVGDGGVMVTASPNSGCAACAMAGRCHLGSAQSERTLFIPTKGDYKPGDDIYFEIEPRGRIGISLILFALPALLLVTGVVVGSNIALGLAVPADFGGVLGGLAGLVLAAPLVWFLSRRARNNPVFEPHICDKPEDQEPQP